jgi:ribonuclease G
MDRTIIINAEHRETRVALLEDRRLVELHVEQRTAESAVGNVYLGKVINTVPAIQAAFVDLGLERHGFLHLGDLRLPGVEIDRNTKIGQVLTKGQKLLVQVQKDPIATKGFKLSMDVSLPGRYSVLMPMTSSSGVSRSISDPEERKRLRSIRKEAGVEEVGVIIRTVAEGKPKSEVARDLRYLMRLWKALKDASDSRNEPGIVYREPDLVEKTLRDAYKQAETRIIVDDEACRNRIVRFLSLYYPRHEFIGEIVLHSEPVPVFKKYRLDRELEKALRRRVDLESGGFLLLEESETLTAIDVNSGKLTKTSGPEETAVRTNLEAAEEVGRQLRLRDIGGMIIVDFIQMGTKKQRNRVYVALKKALSNDRSRAKMSYFSDLELVQITRRRVRESLEKQLTENCPYCKGEGTIFSRETIAAQVLRDLRETLFLHFPTVVKIWVNPDVYHLLMEDQKYLRDLGNKTGSSVILIPDPDKHIQDYTLRPEGIPVVLAASAESKRRRQQLLDAVHSGMTVPATVEEPPSGAQDLPAEPRPAALHEEEPLPVIGFWGDAQMEEEMEAVQAGMLSLEEEEDLDELGTPDEDDTQDEDEKEAEATRSASRRSKENGRRGERRRGRAGRAERPEPEPASEPEPEPVEGEPELAPFLSFRASRRGSLRFSSSRDLRPRDFGRQYELWAGTGDFHSHSPVRGPVQRKSVPALEAEPAARHEPRATDEPEGQRRVASAPAGRSETLPASEAVQAKPLAAEETAAPAWQPAGAAATEAPPAEAAQDEDEMPAEATEESDAETKPARNRGSRRRSRRRSPRSAAKPGDTQNGADAV